MELETANRHIHFTSEIKQLEKHFRCIFIQLFLQVEFVNL